MAIKVEQQVFENHIEDNPVNAISASLGLMKGDILVFAGEGDIRRLPVGSYGQVLTADPSAELGMRWANPS